MTPTLDLAPDPATDEAPAARPARRPLTTLVVIKPELFETAKALGRVNDEQIALINSFIADPDKFLTDFLLAHPDFLANEIAKGGKSAQRAELCIASGFAPEEALPKK